MTLRKFGGRSFGAGNLKSDPAVNSLIRSELKHLIDDSVQEYFLRNKIPVANIGINVDNECRHGQAHCHGDWNKGVRVHKSYSAADIPAASDTKMSEKALNNASVTNEDDNLHWMAWRTFDSTKSRDRNNAVRISASAHVQRCSSPFSRPTTASGHGTYGNGCKESLAHTKENEAALIKEESEDKETMPWMTGRMNDDKPYFKEPRLSTMEHRHRCPSPFSRPNTASSIGRGNNEYKDRRTDYGDSAIRFSDAPKLARCHSAMAISRPKNSVAVGPDTHFAETGTNTQKSYQVSDYLKKNMDLNDAYERSVYSNLMEIMRQKSHRHCGVESQCDDIDPIVQISEYKHKFQNPRAKITFPTSTSQTLITVKKPPKCPHKTRALGQSRGHISSTPVFNNGEQFLY